MKIQCDVCQKVEASFFCPSDEAALCHGCDRTIHSANKVATKHTRLSLHHPNFKDSPLCDICQERRAYIFCQEDRAILCSECDVSIHGANEHTKKHNRFLLTGIKLGAASSSFSSEPTSTSSNGATRSSEAANNQNNNNYYMGSDTGSVSTSSISEYLIETLPGYCMEDLLDASFPPNGFCKEYEQQSFQDRNNNVDHHVNMCSFPLEAWSPSSTPT
ncbi:hypothetical protein PIB30_018482 [Stylosanthes scabra]|uniref:B box-type domain-containing protein n=1 Tax=Stylosanthes scabra TaxID=79078 RepID=A0ABU6W6J3_9FABA|nr:hypothetical protein [Stylosanthes scabra]